MIANRFSPLVKSIATRSAVCRVTNVRTATDYAPAEHKQVSMDDLPVPQGSWQEDYNAKQAKYNKHLALGIAFTVFSIVVAKGSGLLYFNWGPPPYPKSE